MKKFDRATRRAISANRRRIAQLELIAWKKRIDLTGKLQWYWGRKIKEKGWDKACYDQLKYYSKNDYQMAFAHYYEHWPHDWHEIDYYYDAITHKIRKVVESMIYEEADYCHPHDTGVITKYYGRNYRKWDAL